MIYWVPEKTSVHSLVWIHKFNLLGTLGGFEPTQSLIIRNSEDQVFLCDEQDLDNTDSVCLCHLVLDWEFDVGCLAPVILRFKNIYATLTIACIQLHVFTDFLIEASEPDFTIGIRAIRGNFVIVSAWTTSTSTSHHSPACHWFKLMSSLELYKPWVHQKLTSLVNSPDTHSQIRWWGHQQLDSLDVDHVEDTASMANNSLEALILLFFRFPKLDCPVCTRRNQDVQPINLGVN